MSGIDVLLGPTEKKQKLVTHLRPRTGAAKTEEEKGWTPPVQTKLSRVGVTVTGPTEEEKSARKRAREEARASAAPDDAVTPEKIDELLELLDRSKSNEEPAEPEPANESDEDDLENDGSEIPPTFEVGPDLTAEFHDNNNSNDTNDAFGANYAKTNGGTDDKDRRLNVSMYYKQGCFPADLLCLLMTRLNSVPLRNCEIGFVFSGSWWRNRRFNSVSELETFITEKAPERIDVGPVHPSVSTTEQHRRLPLERQLVFDVDIEDAGPACKSGYIRNCRCAGSKQVCAAGCWFYARVAVKCLTYILRKVYGCKHIMVVFSGRRGVHVSVFDKEFVTWDEEARKGVADRVEILGRPWEYVHSEYTYYMYRYILEKEFAAHFLDGQCLLGEREAVRRLLEMVPGGDEERVALQTDLVEQLHRFKKEPSADKRWRIWRRVCEQMEPHVPEFELKYVFTVLYPRIDRPITTSLSHCVKAPFVVHPATKRCAVPIPNIDKWTPDMAPRLSDIVTDPNETSPYGYRPYWEDTQQEQPKAAILAPYVDHFRRALYRAYK